MATVRYVGARTEEGVIVTRELADGTSEPLPLRLDLWNHSPTGFEWGYGGSGPAQLALAILADHLENDAKTVALYPAFKSAVIVNLPYASWTLTSDEIQQALQLPFGERQDETRNECM